MFTGCTVPSVLMAMAWPAVLRVPRCVVKVPLDSGRYRNVWINAGVMMPATDGLASVTS